MMSDEDVKRAVERTMARGGTPEQIMGAVLVIMRTVLTAPNGTVEDRTLNRLLTHYATCPHGTCLCSACRIAEQYAHSVSPYRKEANS